MAGNRLAAETIILTYIRRISPRSGNHSLYKQLFASMSDDRFDTFMSDLASKRSYLSIIEPNGMDTGLSVANNLEIGKDLGHDFFQRLWISSRDQPTYLTPIKYLVVDLPIRRASQLLIKKIKVPEHNRIVDTLSGQPTGDSKGAKISYPELQVCAAMGLTSSMVELMKYRGGDVKGNKAYTNMLAKFGTTNLHTLSQYASGVESTTTLRTFINSMMLRTSL